ncbi:MAG: hypothetical protein IPP36_03525 [Nitrosomonadales bacterium]|nr:hypothetical protein [Nitrosomonadales bacterium]
MKRVRSDESLRLVRWVASGCYIATKLIEAVSKIHPPTADFHVVLTLILTW